MLMVHDPKDIGRALGPSDSWTLAQGVTERFLDATRGQQWIHVAVGEQDVPALIAGLVRAPSA